MRLWQRHHGLVILHPKLRELFDLQFVSIRRALAAELNKCPANTQILDIGSGWNAYEDVLKHFDVTRVDPQWPADYREVAQIPGDKKYDYILLLEVLEHTENPLRVLTQIKRFAHPKTRILLSVPFSARIHPCPDDFQRWTDQGLKKIAENTGLKMQELHYRGRSIHSILSKINFLCFECLKSWWLPLSLLVLAASVPLTLMFRYRLNSTKPNADPLGFFVKLSVQ